MEWTDYQVDWGIQIFISLKAAVDLLVEDNKGNVDELLFVLLDCCSEGSVNIRQDDWKDAMYVGKYLLSKAQAWSM